MISSVDKLTVLFAGKLETKKNPLLLVQAAKVFPDIHFIIVGNGELETSIRDDAGEAKNITLLPFQNQSKMPVVYRMADIFVLPSKGPGETWGLALNEAMASGRIVIASNRCGGAIDLVKDEENGFTINPDLTSFSIALRSLLNMKTRWSDMKERSLELIKRYNLERLSQSIEGIMNTA